MPLLELVAAGLVLVPAVAEAMKAIFRCMSAPEALPQEESLNVTSSSISETDASPGACDEAGMEVSKVTTLRANLFDRTEEGVASLSEATAAVYQQQLYSKVVCARSAVLLDANRPPQEAPARPLVSALRMPS